jgi:hypothetical protein
MIPQLKNKASNTRARKTRENPQRPCRVAKSVTISIGNKRLFFPGTAHYRAPAKK